MIYVLIIEVLRVKLDKIITVDMHVNKLQESVLKLYLNYTLS